MRMVGVGTTPRSITSHPTDWSPAVTARANIGPETRESRPRQTRVPSLDLPEMRAERRGDAGHELGRERRAHPPADAGNADHQSFGKLDRHGAPEYFDR